MPPRPASRPGPPPRPSALAARVCSCCSRRARAAPATPACSPGARPSLRRHPLAGGGMSPHAAPSRLAPWPSAAPVCSCCTRLPLLHASALAARGVPRQHSLLPVCPCCTRLPLLLPASQGSTGDPRLPSRRKAIASQAPPSRGWHVASCRPVPPRAFAIHQLLQANQTIGNDALSG